MEPVASAEDASFRSAYAEHRAQEGRGPLDERALLALPYLQEGRFAHEWAVRAKSFDAFLEGVAAPLGRARGAPLRVLDLGAGNGWLSYRMALAGHHAVAVDVRTDRIDGLGAAAGYREHLNRMFLRAAASFERLPFASAGFDLVVFNASLHYALDLARVIGEAVRVTRKGGLIAVLDSPFYRSDAAGSSMAAEKRATAPRTFGYLAETLAAPRFIEYLTRDRLSQAKRGLDWHQIRVRYPLRYELRPWVARLTLGRQPSRFDVWWTEVR